MKKLKLRLHTLQIYKLILTRGQTNDSNPQWVKVITDKLDTKLENRIDISIKTSIEKLKKYIKAKVLYLPN